VELHTNENLKKTKEVFSCDAKLHRLMLTCIATIVKLHPLYATVLNFVRGIIAIAASADARYLFCWPGVNSGGMCSAVPLGTKSSNFLSFLFRW
jgi:hypothetical protein